MFRSDHASRSPSTDLDFPANPPAIRSSTSSPSGAPSSQLSVSRHSSQRLHSSTPDFDSDDFNSSSSSSSDDASSTTSTNSDDSSSSSSSSSNDSDDPQPQPPLCVPPGGRSYVEPIQPHSLGPINIQWPNCHALHFISEKLTNSLFFSNGEEGWHLDIPLQEVNNCRPHRSKKVTQLLWYAYRLHVCPPEIEPSNIFKGGRLFQQLVCDAWASIDQCNLTWAANNQTTLRADLYQGLQDCMALDGVQDMAQVGCVLLPFTHKGGPRYMQQLF